MRWLFWLSAALIAYTYLGYPLYLYLRSCWRSMAVRSSPVFPAVSVIMAVHNEEAVLPVKLRNLENLNYPADRLEVVICSDGSVDKTNFILSSQTNAQVRAILCPVRQGKAAALNRAIEAARGEIVVFTDARQLIEADAIRHMMANFADPSVGCVSAELMLSNFGDAGKGRGLGLYWEMEKKIRQMESSTSSVVGTTGALYAIRRNLIIPLPHGTILDDVFVPMHVARSGGRVMFEPRARAWDAVATDPRTEFRRKVRTLTGNYQLLQLAPWLLTPANPLLLEFVSHKLLRLMVPFALATLLAGSFVIPGGIYRVALLLQLVCYGLALLALVRPRIGLVSQVANVALTFVVLNTAAAVALFNYVTGKKSAWAG